MSSSENRRVLRPTIAGTTPRSYLGLRGGVQRISWYAGGILNCVRSIHMADSLRSLFMLEPDVTYLNHGSFGACPRVVFEEYQMWQRELERNPMAFMTERLPGLLTEARQALGNYIGTSGENVIYFPNPTTAVRTLSRILRLEPGEEILTTNWEYPGMDQTWELWAYQTGARYVHQPVPVPMQSSEAFVEALWAGVTPRTRIIFMSHIAAFSALIFPVAEICRRAREAGIITIIDGAHALSQIPLDLTALGADIYVGACHKWLCAPKGAGFLAVAPRAQSWILEAFRHTTALGAAAREDPTALNPISALQPQGTRDQAAVLSVPAAISFQAEHDWDAQRVRCHGLASQTRQRITELTGLEPLSPDDPDFYGQMVSIPLPESRFEAIAQSLRDHRVIAVPLRANGRALLRVSYQAYNTQEDVDRLITAVNAGLQGG